MKKNILLLLMTITLLFQTACAESTALNIYTVTRNGIEYTIDSENMVISDEENTYHYTVSRSGNNEVTVTYPDGSSYWWAEGNGVAYGGGSDDYDANKYVDGNVLYDIIMDGNPNRSTGGDPGEFLAAILFAGVGLLNLIAPRSSWYLSHGWKYKNAEPSELFLAVARVGGVAALLVAIMLLISNC